MKDRVTKDQNNALMSVNEALNTYGDWRPFDLPPVEAEIVKPSYSLGPPGPTIEPLVPGTNQEEQELATPMGPAEPQGMCGKLDKPMYGTRDAAKNWEDRAKAQSHDELMVKR